MNFNPEIENAKARVRRRLREAQENIDNEDLKAYLGVLEKRVFVHAFKISILREEKLVSRETEKAFKAKFGMTPKAYVNELKMAETEELLRSKDLKIWQVADFVGVSNKHFSEIFRDRKGKSPEKWRKSATANAPPTRDPAILKSPVPGIRLVSLDLRRDRLAARLLWRVLVKQPFEKQRLVFEAGIVRCATRAFLELLGEKCLEASRLKGRQCGIEIAELAVLSVEVSAASLGKDLQDLRALTRTRLANARRLAFELEGAESAITEAEKAWNAPREERDGVIFVEMLGHKAQIRFAQTRFQEALELLNEQIASARLHGLDQLLAQGLVLRAGVINYSGCLEDSTIGDLEQALALTEDLPAQGRMLLCIFLGLALAYLRVEDCDKAEAQLIKAEEHKRALSEDPVLVTQIQWIRGLIAFEKGDFKLAEEELSSAREQSERLDETSNSLMLTLDIARLWLERGELPKAIELATEALTLLESLNFGPEIVKTLRIFRKAVEIGQIDQAFLERVGRIDIQLNASPELIRWRRP